MSDSATVVTADAPGKKKRGRAKGVKIGPRLTDIERAIFDVCVKNGQAAQDVISTNPDVVNTLVKAALANVKVDEINRRLAENVNWLRVRCGLPPVVKVETPANPS